MKLPRKIKDSFLTRKSEWTPMIEFQNEFNKLFDRWFSDYESLPDISLGTKWTPTVNLSETEKEYRITAELPGLEEKDVEIRFQNNTLYLKGEKKFEEKKEDKEDYHHIESSYGQFQRVMTFPTEVDSEKIAAKMKNGVLTINLMKATDAIKGSRKIEIKS